jgi:hypothetical protein
LSSRSGKRIVYSGHLHETLQIQLVSLKVFRTPCPAVIYLMFQLLQTFEQPGYPADGMKFAQGGEGREGTEEPDMNADLVTKRQ